jgi:tRNA threonylcarbamoyladenosine biosynthesis protein TsaB
MQYILHIDTSTDTGTVAISADGTVLAHRINEETRNHAGTINIMINEVLADLNISLRDLSAIAVCAGPGSYTGLRIGVATAKGICYALDRPLILHNRLTLLAYHSYINKVAASEYIPLLYAREKEYFITIYNSDFSFTLPPQHITESQLHEIFQKKENSYIITDVSEIMINSLGVAYLQIEKHTQINLDSWAKHAFQSYKCNSFVNLTNAEPFYLKQVYTHK